MAADYIPAALGDFVQWITLQKEKRPALAALLGWTAADVARLDAEDDEMLKSITTAASSQATAQKDTNYRDTYRGEYMVKRRASIAHVKTNPAYTAAIGKDNRWLGTTDSKPTDDLKPTVKAIRTADGVRLEWTKLKQDYVQIFRRPAGTADWGRYIAIDGRSPYLDTEPGLKGVYEYKVQLFHNDKPVGQPSDVVVIAVG